MSDQSKRWRRDGSVVLEPGQWAIWKSSGCWHWIAVRVDGSRLTGSAMTRFGARHGAKTDAGYVVREAREPSPWLAELLEQPEVQAELRQFSRMVERGRGKAR